ncbi:hypothetical protein NF27_BK00290 [Candidatus Jidaibacter acanthamoeba]|uniref:Prepilin-type N-terminal cleavage/methylation domain-containing protein n=1 Tax=Candidatus Jidaibacter acanthamoebae TaxID=86105 RepID=A0A0C1QQD7_9RICK|nr:prepilin-type N-terminal cleavage/methylation domain-containing protein [Candidatus Jidaibacter acanthamoeba]KIE06108.1 hypothetical protein NF27_BK00290 [Candidatus Jidaibacter acanthamoeba]
MSLKVKVDKIKGFSLIELSLVLLILAALIAGGMSLSSIQAYKEKYDTTLKNIKLIENALTVFVALNGRLPCPASPAQKILNSTFGREQVTAGAVGTAQSCNSTTTNIFTGSVGGNTQYYGAAPVTTLGLPDEVMFDGWGNRIGYIVTKPFVNSSKTNTSCTSGGSAANVSNNIYFCYRGQASGNSSTSIQVLGEGYYANYAPVYILISHGENGYGAFLKNADVDLDNGGVNGSNADRNPNPPSSNPHELLNLNCNSGACLTQNYVQKEISTPIFDDILLFKNRNNILLDCNKYGNNACTLNEGIIIG